MMNNQNNTPKTNVMNPEMMAKRAEILAKWQKEREERAQADALRRTESIAKLMQKGYSHGDALLVLAAEANPCQSISSIL